MVKQWTGGSLICGSGKVDLERMLDYQRCSFITNWVWVHPVGGQPIGTKSNSQPAIWYMDLGA
jgi:hypothetical protein